VQEAVIAEHAASKSGHRAPAHKYALADFGLTEAEVDARFAEYTARYLR
jgi:hypothetical protein